MCCVVLSECWCCSDVTSGGDDASERGGRCGGGASRDPPVFVHLHAHPQLHLDHDRTRRPLQGPRHRSNDSGRRG